MYDEMAAREQEREGAVILEIDSVDDENEELTIELKERFEKSQKSRLMRQSMKENACLL